MWKNEIFWPIDIVYGRWKFRSAHGFQLHTGAAEFDETKKFWKSFCETVMSIVWLKKTWKIWNSEITLRSVELTCCWCILRISPQNSTTFGTKNNVRSPTVVTFREFLWPLAPESLHTSRYTISKQRRKRNLLLRSNTTLPVYAVRKDRELMQLLFNKSAEFLWFFREFSWKLFRGKIVNSLQSKIFYCRYGHYFQ